MAQDYLILVDRYSDWLDIIPTATRLVKAVRQLFCCSGTPDVFWSDEGLQFKAKLFSEFVMRWRASTTLHLHQDSSRVTGRLKPQ